MQSQVKFTENALFDYYMVSNSSENTVHSQIPFYFDRGSYERIIEYSETINKIALRILRDIKNHERLVGMIDSFPLKERIFSLNCDISPFLWTRFDTFIDTLGNIKFAEFNYDKPCTQKEIAFAGSIPFNGNVNTEFEEKLVSELEKICTDFLGENKKASVAFLVDPCHYEELHIAYYMKRITENKSINIIPVGPKNLSVSDGEVYTFMDQKVDVILRLFPTEYLQEVNDILKILDCFEKGKVLLLNDPRIISIQAKTFFSYLWELAENQSSLLSPLEKKAVRECIPYTRLFGKDKVAEVIENKDSYVVKASFGRYSGEVYIGRLYSIEDWKKQIERVLESSKIHILQDVIDIRKEYTYYADERGMNIPCTAYGNFGTFILGEKASGLCVRWSQDFLTNNDTTWMCPIGARELSLKLERFDAPERKAIWEKVMERAMFEYEFTGQYININEFVSLNSLVLDENLFKEIEEVSARFCKILGKTSELVKSNIDMFAPLLGIPDSLKNLVTNPITDSFCAVGRIDIALESDGTIKILEFNSETPAGLVESMGIQKIIKEELSIRYKDPNESLREDIKNSLERIIADFSRLREIKNIAFLCTSYHEDWYNTSIIRDICKEIKGLNIFFGNIYDLEVKGEKLYLYGTPLDALYRYFPLDWLSMDDELYDIIDVLNKETFSINPTHTLITQSKSIFAVIYELIGKGFYTEEEETFISKHIPYTALQPSETLSRDSLSKPYLSREGGGITMSYEGFDLSDEDLIYQDRINIRPFHMIKYSSLKSEEKFQFPVIGIYITGSKPSGIFTRMGDIITSDSASFVPTFFIEI